jgi:hypothetical protein
VTRAHSFRLWTVALWALCLVAATGGLVHDGDRAVSAGATRAAVGALSATADAAVLPARVADEVRVAAQGAPLRTLVLAAFLAELVGLPAVLRRRASSAAPAQRPLRARRHAIALRAPPLQFAV